MASKEPSTLAKHPAMEALAEKLVQELQQVNTEAGNEPTCVRNPNITSDDYTLGALKGFKLEVEAELEALLTTPLVQLPTDPVWLMGLAREDIERTAHQTARTLQFYKKKVFIFMPILLTSWEFDGTVQAVVPQSLVPQKVGKY